MNERIRLLAEQAGMNAIEPVMDFDRKETHWNGWASAMEKFAELMVEECCQVLSKETISHDGYGYNQHALYQKIREHFGVSKS